jgi:hypothetical protein
VLEAKKGDPIAAFLFSIAGDILFDAIDLISYLISITNFIRI